MKKSFHKSLAVLFALVLVFSVSAVMFATADEAPDYSENYENLTQIGTAFTDEVQGDDGADVAKRGPDNAKDGQVGDGNKIWQAQNTDKPHEWGIKWDEPQTVDTIVIKWRTVTEFSGVQYAEDGELVDNPGGFKSAADGIDWKDASSTNVMYDGDIQVITLDKPVTAKLVKIIINGSMQDNDPDACDYPGEVYEIEMYKVSEDTDDGDDGDDGKTDDGDDGKTDDTDDGKTDDTDDGKTDDTDDGKTDDTDDGKTDDTDDGKTEKPADDKGDKTEKPSDTGVADALIWVTLLGAAAVVAVVTVKKVRA